MFKISATSVKPEFQNRIARSGILQTNHGSVHTPAFMPVATKAYVKTVTPEELLEQGTEVIIANSFLLYLRPGLDIIEHAGGLHKFMNWDKTIFTDSGGFQMIRPDFHAKVDDSGITFQSPFDGTKHLFTPEKCIETQVSLGIDVAMVLDHCPEYGSSIELVKESAKRTTEWAEWSITEMEKLKNDSTPNLPLMFGIAQGGVDMDLREWSAKSLSKLDFDGFGIGGLSIGEPKETMFRVLEHQLKFFLADQPRYLMGVGSPQDVLESISLGVDIFDSVFPTRNARHGTVHTHKGNININRASYAKQFEVIEADCSCSTCHAGFTRAYINHLLKNYSILGMRLATIHNLYFLQKLVQDARDHIEQDTFYDFKAEFLAKFNETNI